jgi:hypothetical protein
MTKHIIGRYKQNHRAVAVNFDGTNDYLTRGGGLTGAVDSKTLTVSTWIKNNSDGSFKTLIESYVSTTIRHQFLKRDINNLSMVLQNSAGTVILNVRTTSGSNAAANGWKHYLLSVDLSDVGKRWLYLNDVSDYQSITYTNDTIDWTLDDWYFGNSLSSSLLSADLANFLFWPGVYLDCSVTANRRMFISAAGKPVHPQVSIDALGVPKMAFYGQLSDWPTNKGSGGAFTMHGALTASATDPN